MHLSHRAWYYLAAECQAPESSPATHQGNHNQGNIDGKHPWLTPCQAQGQALRGHDRTLSPQPT